MLPLFSNSNSNLSDSSDWKVKLRVLLRYVTLQSTLLCCDTLRSLCSHMSLFIGSSFTAAVNSVAASKATYQLNVSLYIVTILQ